MAATNKLPVFKPLGNRTVPISILLPVQAGSTQAIKQGEVCKLRDPSDIATYPIIPAANHGVDFIPVIAVEEQKSTDAARLMEFWLATPDFAFEFALDTATQVKLGDGIEMHDSQTVEVGTSYIVGSTLQEPTDATPTWASVSKVFVVFGLSHAAKLRYFPLCGAAASGQVGQLTDLSDVHTSTATAGNVLVADGTDWESVAISGDITLAANGTVAIASGVVVPDDLAHSADGNVGIPYVARKVAVAGSGGGDVTVATLAHKSLIMNAHMIARDTNAANVTLYNATNAFTAAVAKGATDDAIVAFTKIIAEYDEVAASAAIIANFSAEGAADIFVELLPIA